MQMVGAHLAGTGQGSPLLTPGCAGKQETAAGRALRSAGADCREQRLPEGRAAAPGERPDPGRAPTTARRPQGPALVVPTIPPHSEPPSSRGAASPGLEASPLPAILRPRAAQHPVSGSPGPVGGGPRWQTRKAALPASRPQPRRTGLHLARRCAKGPPLGRWGPPKQKSPTGAPWVHTEQLPLGEGRQGLGRGLSA